LYYTYSLSVFLKKTSNICHTLYKNAHDTAETILGYKDYMLVESAIVLAYHHSYNHETEEHDCFSVHVSSSPCEK